MKKIYFLFFIISFTQLDFFAYSDTIKDTGLTVAVEYSHRNSPLSFIFFQNLNNPLNPSTNISYQISKTGFVSIKVYNILGKEVTTLVNEEKLRKL